MTTAMRLASDARRIRSWLVRRTGMTVGTALECSVGLALWGGLLATLVAVLARM